MGGSSAFTESVGLHLEEAFPLFSQLTVTQAFLLGTATLFLAFLLLSLFLPSSKYPSLRGPKGLPILGNLHEFIGKGPLESLTEWSQTYGGIYKVYLGAKETLVVSDVDLVKEVTVKRFKAFRTRPAPPVVGKDALMGVAFGKDKHWSIARNASLPFFHNSDYLEKYFPCMNDSLSELSAELAALPRGESVELHERLQELTLDVLCRAAFGGPLKADTGGDFQAAAVARVVNETLRAISIPNLSSVLSFFLPGWLSPWLFWVRSLIPYTEERKAWKRNEYQKEVGAALLQTRLHQEEQGHDRRDVLSQLIRSQKNVSKENEDQAALTHREIAYILGEFMIVGSDTTANLLAFTVFLVSTHPEIEVKLMAEIQKLFTHFPPNSVENVEKYSYTHMVVKEVLRLYPTGGQMFREAEEPTTVGGVNVPKGGTVMIMNMMLHRNPKYFHDPNSFIPERFDMGSTESANNDFSAYLPFGAGPRTCLGYKFALQEAMVAVIHLHAEHRFKVVGQCEGLKGNEAIKALQVETVIVTKPKYGLKVLVEPRDTA